MGQQLVKVDGDMAVLMGMQAITKHDARRRGIIFLDFNIFYDRSFFIKCDLKKNIFSFSKFLGKIHYQYTRASKNLNQIYLI